MNSRVIGVPMDLGADRRGVDMGPSALRYAGVADLLESVSDRYEDAGDISVPNPEDRKPNGEQPPEGSARYLREIREVCLSVEAAVTESLRDGGFPLVLGGDHSIAIGSVRGAAAERDVGVLWFDAHADFNTPASSPSGNVHGMPLAALFGRGSFEHMQWTQADIVEENVALIGLRSVDPDEADALAESDIETYTMRDIDSRGIVEVVEEAIGRVGDGVDSLHVSLDMDALDPDETPGVGTPVRGGLTYREAHTAMEIIGDTDALGSMEIVEVNPILDAHNRTAELGMECLASALGRDILSHES